MYHSTLNRIRWDIVKSVQTSLAFTQGRIMITDILVLNLGTPRKSTAHHTLYPKHWQRICIHCPHNTDPLPPHRWEIKIKQGLLVRLRRCTGRRIRHVPLEKGARSRWLSQLFLNFLELFSLFWITRRERIWGILPNFKTRPQLSLRWVFTIRDGGWMRGFNTL